MQNEKIIFVPLNNGDLRVDAAKCGLYFESVAIVKNLDSQNPLITVPKPLGVAAIEKILKALAERNEGNPETPIDLKLGDAVRVVDRESKHYGKNFLVGAIIDEEETIGVVSTASGQWGLSFRPDQIARLDRTLDNPEKSPYPTRN